MRVPVGFFGVKTFLIKKFFYILYKEAAKSKEKNVKNCLGAPNFKNSSGDQWLVTKISSWG